MRKPSEQSPPPLRLEWIEAGSLRDNPHNWRRHPPQQLQSLRDLLNDPEVLWAGAFLYNERTKRLIDGHARKAVVDPKTRVPVLIGRWSEEGERKILATLDPSSALAQADAQAYADLMRTVRFESQAINDLMKGVLGDGAAGAVEEDPAADFPKLGAIYQVIIECSDESAQARAYALCQKAKLKCRLCTLS